MIPNTTGGLTITGPGTSALTVNGNGHRLFEIRTPTGTGVAEAISGLTLTNGNHGAAGGGAIDIETQDLPLSLTSDVISDSTTTGGNGGAIASGGPVTLTGTTITGNTAPSGNGGGIAMTQAEKLTITNSTISGNSAQNGGGMVDTHAGPATSSGITISGSQITGNHATAPSSNGRGGGIDTENNTSLTVSGSTISGNTATGHGGGIFGATKYGTTITSSTISGNTAAAGGGISLYAPAPKYQPNLIQTSTISGNQAPAGAGIELTFIRASSVTIQSSTITGNSGGASSFGGGIDMAGYINSQISVLDSTVSGNTATNGGAVSLGDSHHFPLLSTSDGTRGSISFENSTISGNAATGSGGGIYLGEYLSGSPAAQHSGTATIRSTIVSGNTTGGAAEDLARATGSTSGGFTSAFSLIQSPGSAPLTKQAVITGVDPKLGALASNGGPTKTMLPAGTSPVIDQGHAPNWLTTDQIGNPRTVETAIANPPGGDGTDIGAVELPAASVIVPPIPIPTAGFRASVRGTTLGGRTRPLIVGNTTPVTCTVTTGTLASCVIEVSFRGKLLGSGAVTGRSTSTRLSARITPTKAGLSLFTSNPLGVDGIATAVGSAIGSPSVTGNVHFLPGPTITLPIADRSDTLSRQLRGQLDQIARMLAGERSVT